MLDTLHNLPLQLTTFIGREREVQQTHALLATTRLLTMTGPGGCGKTRLALEVANRLAADPACPRDGIWLVELAALPDAALVPQAVIAALGMRELPGRPLLATLVDALQPRALLLVLDSCEHLIGACAALAETLLRACPHVRILATSREPLGIPGETTWVVPSLSLPDEATLPPEALLSSEAARLFADRATTVLPSFTVSARNAASIGHICRRLDGIPLALELAAARVRVLSTEQIAARLTDSFDLLSGTRGGLARHQTLRATIDWSYALLGEAERVLFERLAVFAGGFTLEAVEVVCAGEGIARDAVLPLLVQLVDKSLVIADVQAGAARYRLLETVRQYALEMLRAHECAHGGLAALRHRHAAFFGELAEATRPEISSAARPAALRRLRTEEDNIRAALAWTREALDAERCLGIAGALWRYWFHRGFWNEGLFWLDAALALPDNASGGPARARALAGAGTLAWSQGDYPIAYTRLSAGAALARAVGDDWGLANNLSFLSQVLLGQGDLDAAYPTALEAVQLYRAAGDDRNASIALTNLGNVARAREDLAQADQLYAESAALMAAGGDPWAQSMPVRNRGIIAFRRGDYERGAAYCQESLRLLRGIGEHWFISRGLETLAVIRALQGRHAEAACLFGAGERLRAAVGAPIVYFYSDEYERGVAAARAGLSTPAFEAAWQRGAALTLDEAVAYALDGGEFRVPSSEFCVVEVDSNAPISAAELDTEPALSVPKEHSELGIRNSELRVRALGPLEVSLDDQALTAGDWSYAKPRELLLYLLLYPPRTKEQIGRELWPEATPAQLRSSFHATLHHLRRSIGSAERVLFQGGRYAFNRALAYTFDVEDLWRRLDDATRLANVDPPAAIAALETASALYRGDFLGGLLEADWQQPLHDELAQRFLDAQLLLGRLQLAEGAYERAAAAYQRAIDHDDYLEDAHRGLLRCYVRAGERNRALLHYQQLVERLREELDAAPAPETSALADRIRLGADV